MFPMDGDEQQLDPQESRPRAGRRAAAAAAATRPVPAIYEQGGEEVCERARWIGEMTFERSSQSWAPLQLTPVQWLISPPIGGSTFLARTRTAIQARRG